MGGKAAIAAAFLMALSAGGAHAACQADHVTELPVTMTRSKPVVSIRINGAPATMVADTGSNYSSLHLPEALRFKLYTRSLPTEWQTLTGELRPGIGLAEDVLVGDAALHLIDFLLVGSPSGPADGLLGENILGRFDAEYDLAHGMIRLWWPAVCPDAMAAQWSENGAVSAITYEGGEQQEVLGRAEINGRRIRVLFDTGSSRSLLSGRGAKLAGIDIGAPGVRAGAELYGANGGSTRSWSAPVDSFSIGRETIRSTQLVVAGFELDQAEMILGADFFLSHRILVSHRQRKIYFAYNGGPVFAQGAAGVSETVTAPSLATHAPAP